MDEKKLQKGKGGMGIQKHRKSGKVHKVTHFHGPTSGKRKRRGGLSRKQRKQKCGTHINKYKLE